MKSALDGKRSQSSEMALLKVNCELQTHKVEVLVLFSFSSLEIPYPDHSTLGILLIRVSVVSGRRVICYFEHELPRQQRIGIP